MGLSIVGSDDWSSVVRTWVRFLRRCYLTNQCHNSDFRPIIALLLPPSFPLPKLHSPRQAASWLSLLWKKWMGKSARWRCADLACQTAGSTMSPSRRGDGNHVILVVHVCCHPVNAGLAVMTLLSRSVVTQSMQGWQSCHFCPCLLYAGGKACNGLNVQRRMVGGVGPILNIVPDWR